MLYRQIAKEIEKQQIENESGIKMINELENVFILLYIYKQGDKLLDNNILTIQQQIENKIIENKKQEELKISLNKEEQSFSELIEYKNQLSLDIINMRDIKREKEKENERKLAEYEELNNKKDKMEKEVIENEELLKSKSNELKLISDEISNLNIQIKDITKNYSKKNDNKIIELSEEMKIEIDKKIENDIIIIEQEHIKKCQIIEETGNKMKEEIRKGYKERTEKRIKLLEQQYEKKKKDELLKKERSINDNKISIYNTTTKSAKICKKPAIIPPPSPITTKIETSKKKQFKSSIQKTRKTKKNVISSVIKSKAEINDSDWFNDDIFAFN